MDRLAQRPDCTTDRSRRCYGAVLLTLLLILGTALLIAGCSGAADQEGSSWDPMIAGMVATAKGFQADLLSDGDLTYAEYERAVLAQVQCMEDAGYEANGPMPSRGHQIVYDYEAVKGDPDALVSTFDDCYSQYLDVVEPVWAYLHQPTEQEKFDEIQSLSACLFEAGSDVPDDPTYGELLDLVPGAGEAGIHCLLQSYDVYSASGS